MKAIFLTGLPSSGKTTIGTEVVKRLPKALLLDGDALRAINPTGFSKEDRTKHITSVGKFAKLCLDQGVVPVLALVAPYEEARNQILEILPTVLVHVSTSLEECERRDVKGLYKKARSGEINNMTGIQDPYEIPTSPDLRLDTSVMTLDECVEAILAKVV